MSSLVLFLAAIYVLISLVGIAFFGMNMLTLLILSAELAVFTIIAVPLLLAIAWKKGYLRTLFMTVETGNIGFVDAGETNVYTYPNIPGKTLDEHGELVDTNTLDKDGNRTHEEFSQNRFWKNWIMRKLGFYWVGFGFLGRKIHMFSITKEREAKKLVPGMDPGEWIERDPNPVLVSGLRYKFPRPVLVPDVKFTDNIEANILVLCKFEVLKPNVLVYTLKGNFFEILTSFVRSGVVDYCQKKSAVLFKDADKLDGGEMSREIIEAINNKIEDTVGVRLTGLAIPIYNASKDAEEEALKAAELARLNGLATVAKAKADAEARVVKADADAKAKIIDAEAEARADNLRNAASITDVTLAAQALKDMGADPNIATQGAVAVGRATRYSDPNSKVTTLVEGQSSTPVALPLK
ncbi:MAG: hypothetical protein WAX37_02200 [Minisyncoccia bacterium]